MDKVRLLLLDNNQHLVNSHQQEGACLEDNKQHKAEDSLVPSLQEQDYLEEDKLHRHLSVEPKHQAGLDNNRLDQVYSGPQRRFPQ